MRKLFWLISRPEVATPPAFDAFPGENIIPCLWNNSTASGVHGMFAPSPKACKPCVINCCASSPLSSFCVAHGNATSQATLHGVPLWKEIVSKAVAASLMRPRRMFLSSMTKANCSEVSPASARMYPDESLRVVT